MHRQVCFVISAAALTMGSSCPPQETTPDNPSVFEPRSWSQVHGDRQNSGFDAVHTTFALPPLKKWKRTVGELAFSSPVIGPDGVIYVGNTAGEVVALNPDGSQRWRRQVDQSILASPAVNTVNGDVFVIGQTPVDANTFTSKLFHLDSGAGLHNISRDPFSTTAAPKLWRDFVFVPSGRKLLVFDQATLSLFAQVGPIDCINLVCGGSDINFDWLPLEIKGLICIVSERSSSLTEITDCFLHANDTSVPSLPPLASEPAVAIVDSPALAGDPNRPIIIVVTNQCATAIRFFPDGDAPKQGFPPIDRHFDFLWSHPLVAVDCDFDTVRSTTPIVDLGGQVILGDENGRVLSLDLSTGNELWHQNPDLQFHGRVTCPPVVFLRQIYVPMSRVLMELDSNGRFVTTSPLRGGGQGAAMSLDFVYVATFQGIHTFNLNPDEGFTFDGSIVDQPHLGLSFPALGEDGTVYVSTPAGFVHAFGKQGFLAKAVAIPVVSWQMPIDGAEAEPCARTVVAGRRRGRWRRRVSGKRFSCFRRGWDAVRDHREWQDRLLRHEQAAHPRHAHADRVRHGRERRDQQRSDHRRGRQPAGRRGQHAAQRCHFFPVESRRFQRGGIHHVHCPGQ